MKFFAAILFCLLAYVGFAQTKSISFQTDNDAYLFNGHDRYYTNGFFVSYSNKVNKPKKNYEQHFSLAQKIYTPLFLDLTSTQLMDRPFCGYLFAEYGRTSFAKNNIIKWNFSLGTIGKASLGKDLQESIHDAIGLYEVSGWQYQVQQNACINAGLTYMPVMLNTQQKISIKTLSVLSANIGNVYTNAQTGILLAAGFMNDIFKSSLVSNISTNKTECYLYFQPQIIFQAYNATVQGSMLNKNNQSFTSQPTVVMYQQVAGLAFSIHKILFKLEVDYQTEECKTQFKPHEFGSIQFTYRLK